MTNFDPTHDKISDQPVTIGGDKSAAAWHGAHADLSTLDKVTASYDEALREARAERDALAHVIEQVRKLNVRSAGGYYVEQIRLLLDSAPSVITAEVNAEIWDAGVRAAGGYGHEDAWTHDMTPYSENPFRNKAK